MEKINYLAFAIPAFFLFVYLEYMLAVRKNKAHFFKYESSVANISIGIAERLLNLFIAASFYELFSYVYQNYALFNIPNTWWVWVLLILATDFVWYWYRAGKRLCGNAGNRYFNLDFHCGSGYPFISQPDLGWSSPGKITDIRNSACKYLVFPSR